MIDYQELPTNSTLRKSKVKELVNNQAGEFCDMLVREITEEAMNKMIKPGTPVRCRDDNDETWSRIDEWFYIGPAKSGWNVVEDRNGSLCTWKYAEPLPRKLKPGDSVYASNSHIDLNDHDSYVRCIFDGMYKDEFVCILEGNRFVFKNAVFADE